MDMYDKFCCVFQVVAAVCFVVFALMLLVLTLVKGQDFVLVLCFGAMLALAWRLLRLSVSELKGLKGGAR